MRILLLCFSLLISFNTTAMSTQQFKQKTESYTDMRCKDKIELWKLMIKYSRNTKNANHYNKRLKYWEKRCK